MHNFIVSVEIPTLKSVDVLDVSMLGKNILEILYYRFEEITHNFVLNISVFAISTLFIPF